MHLRLSLCLLTGLLALPLVDAQTPGPTPTVDELVAKNLEAKGGAAALEAIKTIRFEGRLLVNQGQLELKYTETKKRPGKVRTDAVLQGMNLVQAYNGTSGWKIFPLYGRKDPEKMSADESKSLVEEAEIGGPLENWKAAGQNRDLPRDRRRRRDRGTQAEGGAQERRYELRLSRSGLFSRDPHHRSARSSRARRSKSRPTLATTKRSTEFTSRSRSRPGAKARPTNKRPSSKRARPISRLTTRIFEFPAKAAK